jgi:ubiquinone/menaquinone biosynthesis C-methylase UbiE
MEATTTVETQDAEQIRQVVHVMWASVAESWGRYAVFIDTRGRALTGRLLDLSAVRSGERVLELAGGPGGLGLAAASHVGPEGEVVTSDIALEMTAIASERAHALGLHNVRTRVLDLEAIDEPDGSYDVVLCRDGLQFATEPERAAHEIRRVLRPGGRVAVATWGPRERNPWLGIVLDAASAHLGMPMPPPGIPGPFSLDDADRLHSLLVEAGLAGVSVTEFPIPMHAPSFDGWWAMTTALAGPLANLLASLPDEASRAIRERANAAAAHYQTASGLEFPGVGLVANGHRPR